MRRCSSYSSLVAVLLALAGGGCGTDAYEARMKDTIDDLKHDNKFIGVDKVFTALVVPPAAGVAVPPESVVEIAPRIKLPERPRKFAAAYKADSPNPDNAGERIPENRVFPPLPLPQIPGFQEEFEQLVSTTVGTRPWHLYVGVVRYPKGVPGGTAGYVASVIDTLKADIAKEDAAEVAAGLTPFVNTTEPAWRDVTFLAARRGATPYTWKVLEINRPQLFYVQGNLPTKVPGICRLMVLDVPAKAPNADHQVVLMWRYPAQAAAAKEINDLITASMGTFEIDPAPAASPAPKPN